MDVYKNLPFVLLHVGVLLLLVSACTGYMDLTISGNLLLAFPWLTTYFIFRTYGGQFDIERCPVNLNSILNNMVNNYPNKLEQVLHVLILLMP